MLSHIKNAILTFFACLLLFTAGCCAYLFYQERLKPDPMDEYDYEDVQDLVVTMEVPEDTLAEPIIQYDLNEMLATNSDFSGWLYIPDGHINLPVVTGSDNSWYLTHSFTKAYSSFGCPFIDTGTPTGSRNRVIHGHNMGSKRIEMFSRLLDYQDPSYAEEHKMIYFSEPDREGERYEVFAVLNFDTDKLDSLNYLQPDFDTEEEFQKFVSYLKINSLFTSDFEPTSEILILSTCNRYYGDSNRLIVCAGKV